MNLLRIVKKTFLMPCVILMTNITLVSACPFCYPGRTESGDWICRGLHEWKYGGWSYGFYWEWGDVWGSSNVKYHDLYGGTWFDAGLVPIGNSMLATPIDNASAPAPKTALTKDPINVLSGAVIETEEDLFLYSPIFPIRISRHYLSSRKESSFVGLGWRLSTDFRIDFTNDCPYLDWPNGDTLPFIKTFAEEGNAWRTYRDKDWFLYQTTNGIFQLDMGYAGSIEFLENGHPVVIRNGDGMELRYVYDSQGRLVQLFRENEVTLNFSYQGNMLVSIESSRGDYGVTYSYAANNNLLYARIHTGDLISETTYIYGQHGLIQRINAVGECFEYNYESDENAFDFGLAKEMHSFNGYWDHEIEYHTNVWVSSGEWMMDESGPEWLWGEVWVDTSHWESGWQTDVTYWNESEPLIYKYFFSDDRQRVLSVLGPNSERMGISYEYDSLNRMIKKKRHKYEQYNIAGSVQEIKHEALYSAEYASVANPSALRYNFGNTQLDLMIDWNLENNQIRSFSDNAGERVEFSYCENGNISKEYLMSDGVIAEEKQFSYETNGLLSAVFDNLGCGTTIERDIRGNPIRITTPNSVQLNYEYSPYNYNTSVKIRESLIICRTIEPDGRITKELFADGSSNLFEYDALRRITRFRDRKGRSVRFSYAIGNLMTNAVMSYVEAGTNAYRSLEIKYDSQGNMRLVSENSTNILEAYGYDECDRVSEITNALGRVTRISYGVNDLPQTIIRPDGSTRDYSWTALGLDKITYPNSIVQYERFPNGRITSLSNEQGKVSFLYDKLGSVTNVQTASGNINYCYLRTGLPTQTIFQNGQVLYLRNETGTITNLIWQIGENQYKFDMNYNFSNGALEHLHYPNGNYKTFTYDNLNRVKQIGFINNNDCESISYLYDSADCITSIVSTTGIQKNYMYDAMDCMIREEIITPSLNTQNRSYLYDSRGNQLRAVLNNDQQNYQTVLECFFDEGNQLTSRKSTSFDSYGLKCETNETFIYNSLGLLQSSQSISSVGESTNISYLWTDDDRLRTITKNENPISSFSYDALGRLCFISMQTNSWFILWDGDHELADLDEEGNISRVYMRLPGMDQWLGFVNIENGVPTTPYFYQTDAMGTVLAVKDENRIVVEKYEYDAWGNILSIQDHNGNTYPSSKIGNRFFWKGRTYFEEIGLYYFRNRWYNPRLGRWISEDLKGLAGGINLHIAFANNPVSWVDPFGLATIRVDTTDNRKIIINNRSVADFLKIINDLPSHSIRNLSIYDHGAPTFMSMDGENGGATLLGGKVILDYNGQPFAEFLRPKMVTGGKILLSGCKTAYPLFDTNCENISKALSRELPDIFITGNIGYAFGLKDYVGAIIDFFDGNGFTRNIGIRRTYLNGVKK